MKDPIKVGIIGLGGTIEQHNRYSRRRTECPTRRAWLTQTQLVGKRSWTGSKVSAFLTIIDRCLMPAI